MGVENQDAVAFVNGWVVGYMEAGGSLADEGLAEKAVRAYQRRLQPPSLPEPVSILLDDAIAAVRAQDVAQRPEPEPVQDVRGG